MLCTGLFLGGCTHQSENQSKETGHAAEHQGHSNEKSSKTEASGKQTMKQVDYAVKKDLICGMPISAGVTDTAHYKGKIYGFCAPECKADFVKDPEALLAAQ